MAIFSSEAEMQTWLHKELTENNSLSHLIVNEDYLDGFKPNNIQEQKLIDSYRACWKSFHVTELLTANENISMKPGESLKPDFVLYAAETESLIIIELKNLPSSTRDAGTEIGAYANELRSYLPFIADGDIINVVISSAWPTLLRHYVFHEMFWLQRRVICLEPISESGQLRLKIKEISEFADGDISLKISDRHIGGYQLCLYDDSLYGPHPDRSRLDQHLEQMKTALVAMATKGDSKKSHGFAFLWKDNWELSLAPYSITMLNFAPFQGVSRFLLKLEADEQPTAMQNKFINLVREYDPTGHSQSLEDIMDVGCIFLKGFCSPAPEGFADWRALKPIMLGRSGLISFRGWGIFGEIFFDRLAAEYQAGDISIAVDCPRLGLKVIEDLIDPDYPDIDVNFYMSDLSEEDE